MTPERADAEDPRIRGALKELREMIQRNYPAATFEVSHGEDPEGLYLTPTVDVDDTEEVFDVVVDRLLQMQIEEQLPIYVIPVRPAERVLQELRAQADSRSYARRRSALDLKSSAPKVHPRQPFR